MLIKSTDACPAIVANDGCRLFELLHPKNDPVDLPFSVAVAEVAPGEASYRHRLRQAEVYYLVDGRGLMHVDEEARPVAVGDAVFIPANAVQWIENPGPDVLRFIALVAPPWRAEDDERL
ncbi:MAG: cupin domain-containing protein [Gammaproteobacteria bacterium]